MNESKRELKVGDRVRVPNGWIMYSPETGRRIHASDLGAVVVGRDGGLYIFQHESGATSRLPVGSSRVPEIEVLEPAAPSKERDEGPREEPRCASCTFATGTDKQHRGAAGEPLAWCAMCGQSTPGRFTGRTLAATPPVVEGKRDPAKPQTPARHFNAAYLEAMAKLRAEEGVQDPKRCRHGEACSVCVPRKPEPFVPSVSFEDLLPDAST